MVSGGAFNRGTRVAARSKPSGGCPREGHGPRYAVRMALTVITPKESPVMDDLTCTDPPVERPMFLDQDWRAIEYRLELERQPEDAQVVDYQEAQAGDMVVLAAKADVPLPFATPPSAALTV